MRDAHGEFLGTAVACSLTSSSCSVSTASSGSTSAPDTGRFAGGARPGVIPRRAPALHGPGLHHALVAAPPSVPQAPGGVPRPAGGLRQLIDLRRTQTHHPVAGPGSPAYPPSGRIPRAVGDRRARPRALSTRVPRRDHGSSAHPADPRASAHGPRDRRERATPARPLRDGPRREARPWLLRHSDSFGAGHGACSSGGRDAVLSGRGRVPSGRSRDTPAP